MEAVQTTALSRGRDLAFAGGVVGHSCHSLPADSSSADRHGPCPFGRHVRPDPHGGSVDSEAARILGLSDRPPHRDPVAACPEHRVDPPDPLRRPQGRRCGRACDQRLLPIRDERRLRHRYRRLHHPHHRQLPGHHQGRDPHRGGRRPLHPRCHPRQADGHRRGSVRRPDRREGSTAAGGGSSRRKAPSSAPWTVPPSSSAARPSRA